MGMKYRDAIKKVADGKDDQETCDILIKDMNRFINDMLDYRYMVNHYDGKDKLAEAVGTIKNSMATLMGDLEVYAELMDITDQLQSKKENRIIRFAEKKKRS